MTTYISQYPPVHSSTYVKATSTLAGDYYPYNATNPAKSVIDGPSGNQWSAQSGGVTQKFNVDLGESLVIKRLYLENAHENGAYTTYGVRDILVYGTDSATAFSNVDYDTTTDLTLIATLTVAQHVATNTANPQYFLLTNSTAYRYMVMRVVTNYGGLMSAIRRIEYQVEDELSLSGGGSFTSPTPTVSGSGWRQIGGGSFTPPTPTISGSGWRQIEGGGVFESPSPALSGLGTRPITAYGGLAVTSPTLQGFGLVDTYAHGSFLQQAPAISGYGINTIFAYGDFKVNRCKIHGDFGGVGAFISPTSTIEAIGVVDIIGDGEIEAKSPGLSMYGIAGITGTGEYSVRATEVKGSGTASFIGTGKFILCAPEINGSAYPVPEGNGSLVAGCPVMKSAGFVSSQFNVIRHHRPGTGPLTQ